MRFLCLHGNGANSNIMKLQTSLLRHELEDDEHEFDFLEATLESPASPEVEALATPEQRFFSWFDPTNFATIPYCINQLEDYISTEGPYDGVIGFSAGAALAAFYMIEKKRRDSDLPFKCAIFLSSAPSAAVQNYLHVQEPDLICIPTAHVWGTNDKIAPTGGEELRRLCDLATQSVVIHDAGHEVPRKSHITEAVHSIRRTIYLVN